MWRKREQNEQEAQLSQRDRPAACLNYGKNISAKSVHLGYFLKSPVATVSSRALSRFTHYVYASFGHVTCAPCAPCRTHWPYLSVLIGFHVIHPNTSLSSVNQHLLLIRYSIAIIAMQIEHLSHFVKTQAPVATPGLRLLNAKYTFKGTSPTNHFCTDS